MFTESLVRASTALARWSVRGGGGLMFLGAMTVAADVLLRKLFSVTFGGADELAGYAMAITSHRNWTHAIGFAAVFSLTFYVILDLEYPRQGLIRVDKMDKVLLDLRASMD